MSKLYISGLRKLYLQGKGTYLYFLQKTENWICSNLKDLTKLYRRTLGPELVLRSTRRKRMVRPIDTLKNRKIYILQYRLVVKH